MGRTPSLEILVVEDNLALQQAVQELLQRAGYATTGVDNARKALQKLQQQFFDLVISDYKMEGMNGLELLKEIKKNWPATEVLIITAYGTISKGVEAIKCGAFDYLTKPFENETLLQRISVFEEQRLQYDQHQDMLRELRSKPELDRIIGNSSKILQTLATVARIAKTDGTVLIFGESGTGKELIAKAIHNLSHRRSAPFIALNCGAIPENLQESELFGHAKGAFTSAQFHKQGLVEIADTGTIFLDEIAETAQATQVKLLRFLQEKEYRRVGENKIRRVDVRMIAATNKNLKEIVDRGQFREDLYYRLNVIPITVPPLRERKEDIPLLAQHFIQHSNILRKRPVKRLSRRARSMLLNYFWPGNVRELENVIQRAIALADGEEITPELLPHEIRFQQQTEGLGNAKGKLSEIESVVILQTLRRMDGHRMKTARALGISKATLWRKLKEIPEALKSEYLN